MVEDYNYRRQLFVKGLREIGLSCFEPQGAFYSFPSIEVTGLSSEDFCSRLLEEEKVAAIPVMLSAALGKDLFVVVTPPV